MAPKLSLEQPWKTDRPKQGFRVMELQVGDGIEIGGQEFRIVKMLRGCRFILSPTGRRVCREVR